MKVLNILLVLFVSQYMMLLVAADKDLTCKAGERVIGSGKIFTSGLASQCSGLSKITTAAECKAAAESYTPPDERTNYARPSDL